MKMRHAVPIAIVFATAASVTSALAQIDPKKVPMGNPDALYTTCIKGFTPKPLQTSKKTPQLYKCSSVDLKCVAGFELGPALLEGTKFVYTCTPIKNQPK